MFRKPRIENRESRIENRESDDENREWRIENRARARSVRLRRTMAHQNQNAIIVRQQHCQANLNHILIFLQMTRGAPISNLIVTILELRISSLEFYIPHSTFRLTASPFQSSGNLSLPNLPRKCVPESFPFSRCAPNGLRG